MASKTINYLGGQQIDNSEKVTEKISTATTPIVASVNNEVSRATGRENEIEAEITNAEGLIAQEVTNRQQAVSSVSTKIGELTNLETTAKSNLVAAINEVHASLPVAQVIDDHLDENSTNAVQNKSIAKSIADNRVEVDLEINELNDTVQSILPLDDRPTANSAKGVKSGGVYSALAASAVLIGETMFWPNYTEETRTVHSDNPFTFEFAGNQYSVITQDDSVKLLISDNVPEGWHALNGKAELLASEYSELAAFMPNNVTTDGKIWLPYVQQKIIKVRY